MNTLRRRLCQDPIAIMSLAMICIAAITASANQTVPAKEIVWVSRATQAQTTRTGKVDYEIVANDVGIEIRDVPTNAIDHMLATWQPVNGKIQHVSKKDATTIRVITEYHIPSGEPIQILKEDPATMTIIIGKKGPDTCLSAVTLTKPNPESKPTSVTATTAVQL